MAEETSGNTTGETGNQRPAEDPTAREMPEPTVQMLVADFYQQALISLGVVENPITGEKNRLPQVASYLIDLIALLKDKMQGNLEPQEEKYISSVLHDLRMRFISNPSESGASGSASSGAEQGSEPGE